MSMSNREMQLRNLLIGLGVNDVNKLLKENPRQFKKLGKQMHDAMLNLCQINENLLKGKTNK